MARDREITTTQTWDDYQRGLDYLRRRNYFDDMDKANRFYVGDQWYGLQAGAETPPMFNFIKPTVKYKASVVGQNDLEIVYNPMDVTGAERELYDATCNALNQLAAQTWERLKLSRVLWDDIKDSFVMGSKYRYFYVEDGQQQIKMTEIAPTNIFFGDEQNANIQEQPYIIISQRRPVQDVREEARTLGAKAADVESIQPDTDTDNELGDNADEEVNQGNERYGKCTTLVRFERKDGVMYVSRATRTVEYQPPTAIEGMTLYPIAGMLIERIKGTARGMGEVLPLIPNQISVNKQLYRIEQSLKQSAFPRLVYSQDIVENPEDIDTIGKPLSIENGQCRRYPQLYLLFKRNANVIGRVFVGGPHCKRDARPCGRRRCGDRRGRPDKSERYGHSCGAAVCGAARVGGGRGVYPIPRGYSPYMVRPVEYIRSRWVTGCAV